MNNKINLQLIMMYTLFGFVFDKVLFSCLTHVIFKSGPIIENSAHPTFLDYYKTFGWQVQI